MPTLSPSRLHRTVARLACLATLVCLSPGAARAQQPPTAGPDQSLEMDEDTSLGFELLGSDPDGDPLSAVVTDLFLVAGAHELVDSSGEPVTVGSVVADRQLLFTPQEHFNGPDLAIVTYRVNDGTQDSALTATVDIHVHPVNDMPFPTLVPVVDLDEDSAALFALGGGDIEGHIFYARMTVQPDEDDQGTMIWDSSQFGEVDMSGPGAPQQMVTVPSDAAAGWPLRYEPDPDHCDEVALSGFSYLFEESPTQQGDEATTVLRVRCTNDAPVWTTATLGDQRFLSASTHLASDSTPYSLPSTFGFFDVDGSGHQTGPDPGLQRFTILTGGQGTVAIDEMQLPGPPIESTPTLLVFEVPATLVDDVLATLTYTADAGASSDTLTLLANDQGSNTGCVSSADGPTCPLVAGLRIDIAIGAGGAPPGAMPLTFAAGGFIPVDTTDDDDTPNGNCTLREAVEASNDDVAVDGCPAGDGVDVIVLPVGTFPLDLGLLPITDDALIVGAGEGLTRIDGLGHAEAFELFDTLTLRDVSVVGLDGDGDGIRTPVDGRFVGGSFVDESETPSSSFTDQHLGGTTFGEIVDNDGLDLVVTDATHPQGVTVAVSGSATESAEIEICSTSVSILLQGGDTTTVTCDVATATALSAIDPDPSVVGQPVTVSVAVDPLDVPGAGPVTGEVTVDDGAGADCTGTLSDGTASCQLTPTVAGTREWSAIYAPDGVFSGSGATLTHTIAPTSTATTIVADTPDPSPAWQPFQVDVAVGVVAPGSGVPTGNVTVEDGAGAQCVAALSAGVGSCLLTPTLPGQRDLVATYSGAPNHLASSDTEPHQVDGTDFGDAPAPYPVLLADDGARHAFGSLSLGAGIDADADGQPSPEALGDDLAGSDDEDGVSFVGPVATGSSVDLTLVASAPGVLDAWIDFGRDGSWIEAGDRIATAVPLVAGSNTVTVAVPADAVPGATFGRFRLSSAGVAGPIGAAADGEVEDHAVNVVDGIAPGVQTVADLDGMVFDDCATVDRAPGGLRVTFDEPVQHADQVGSYVVLSAGPDADLTTTSCGGIQGDDVAHAVTGVTSDLDPTTPTFTLELQAGLPEGLVRLIVCEAVEDLAGLALDGDGDGLGGDPFPRTFRVETDNLLRNGHFDRCPVTLSPWIDVATPPNTVLPSETEDVDSSSLSGSASFFSASAEPSALGQCVEIQQVAPRLELAFSARLDAIGVTTATVGADCQYFDQPSCAGSPAGSGTDSAPLPDLAGSWSSFAFSFDLTPSTVSVLCGIVIAADDPDESSFEAFLDEVSLTESPLFADGFESGGTGAWSGVSARRSSASCGDHTSTGGREQSSHATDAAPIT